MSLAFKGPAHMLRGFCVKVAYYPSAQRLSTTAISSESIRSLCSAIPTPLQQSADMPDISPSHLQSPPPLLPPSLNHSSSLHPPLFSPPFPFPSPLCSCPVIVDRHSYTLWSLHQCQPAAQHTNTSTALQQLRGRRQLAYYLMFLNNSKT
jgi:hypothetical protein